MTLSDPTPLFESLGSHSARAFIPDERANPRKRGTGLERDSGSGLSQREDVGRDGGAHRG